MGLKNRSSRPHYSPNKTPEHVERLVLEIFQKTNYGFRRTGRRYYNLLDFRPFAFFQVDVKEIKDGDTLPAEVYCLRSRGEFC
ncbi:MAG: hypothetical protein ABIL39_04545 [candidate division WOR-3 bacterium]